MSYWIDYKDIVIPIPMGPVPKAQFQKQWRAFIEATHEPYSEYPMPTVEESEAWFEKYNARPADPPSHLLREVQWVEAQEINWDAINRPTDVPPVQPASRIASSFTSVRPQDNRS